MIKAVAANAQLGTGFKESSLREAAVGADFIGCDAGSTDAGPYYLGSGMSQSSDSAVARDLELIITEGLKNNIPVLIGSAGTAGARPHLERTVQIVRNLAVKNAWHFLLAIIDSEISADRVVDAYNNNKLTALNGAPAISAESIRRAEHIVAMQGPECFIDALERGANVIIAGRTSDTSIYAAIPMMRGIPVGVAFHAAKILECAAACVVDRPYTDSMVATLDHNGFTIEPPNPVMACTPQSVASHTFYETADPFRLVEPNGTLNTSNAVYTAVSDRAVRVTGNQFELTDDYTTKLEAATLIGYRTVVFAGVRDPLVVAQIEPYVAKTQSVVEGKIFDSLGLEKDDYHIRWNIYGQNGCLGPMEPENRVTGHEVALLIDIVASEQEVAQAIGSIAWHTALHRPIPEYSGLLSNLAFPISPPGINAGPVYEFSINHVMHVEKPNDAYTLNVEQI